MYFTDSPFERMMEEKPSGKPETETLPPGHPCHGCGYCKGENRVGYCLRELLKEKMDTLKA